MSLEYFLEVNMLKNAILNSNLIELLCRLGHTQTICICDAGLPIPSNKEVIDLAFLPGCPDISTVLSGILACTPFEKAYCATESQIENLSFMTFLKEHLECEICTMPHEDLKNLSQSCTAFIRTGECTPYANVILQACTTF